MRARDVEVGQTFYATWLGAAISPYITVAAVDKSPGETVRITLPDGSTKEFKKSQRIRVVTKK
jgi:hypothetical protein